jgi:hypothetical protein
MKLRWRVVNNGTFDRKSTLIAMLLTSPSKFGPVIVYKVQGHKGLPASDRRALLAPRSRTSLDKPVVCHIANKFPLSCNPKVHYRPTIPSLVGFI